VTREAALVGDTEWRGGVEVEEAEVAGARGSRGSDSSSRAAPASRRAAQLRAPPPPPSLLLLLRLRVGEQGTGSPGRLGFGESQGWRRRLLIAAVARGTWTAQMRREVARRVATAAMTGVAPRFGAGVSQSAKARG
jgi:hypothetical protein